MPPAVLALALQALSRRGVDARADEAGQLVVDLGGRLAVLDLGSLRRIVALCPAEQAPERADHWAGLVLATLDGQPPEGPVHERLLPRILPGPDPRLWSEPLAGGPLHLALAEDLPGRVRLLSPFDLPRIGLSLRDARRVALQNLLAATPPPEHDDGVLCWAVGDGYDAARLLLAAAFVDAPLGALALAPARDLCWLQPVAGRDDVLRALDLRSAAARLGHLPYALPPVLIWVHADGHHAVRLHAEGDRLHVALPPGLAERLEPH